MAQPSPRSNFLQTLLIMVTVFLGLQLLMPRNDGTMDYFGKRLTSYREHWGALADANARLYDSTAAGVKGNLDRLIDKEVNEKRLTREEGDRQKLQATVLLADTQLKAGLARNDTGRIRNAYHTLFGLHNALQTKPIWNEPFPVADTTGDQRFGWREWTPAALWDRSVADISERSRHDLIWGFIPGGYALIDFLVHLTGAQPAFSYAFAAFLLAVLVRAAVWPLAQKQIMFGRQMMQLQPLASEIRAQYKDKPEKQLEMQRKLTELYQEYGVNPMAGCFPALVQLPLFLTVYQCMLLYQFEFTKGTFLWVNPQTSALLPPGLVAPNLGALDPTLIVLYGIFMVINTLITPVSDPMQARQQRLMGIGISIFFTVTMFFGWFPVPGAFVLYWIFLLVLSSLQALRAYRLPVPPLVKVNTAAGGVYPKGMGGKWAQRMQEMMQAAEAQQTSSNGKPSANGSNGSANGVVRTGEVKTGRPVTHKPKKRK